MSYSVVITMACVYFAVINANRKLCIAVLSCLYNGGVAPGIVVCVINYGIDTGVC